MSERATVLPIRAILPAIAAVLCISCASTAMRLPGGPGIPGTGEEAGFVYLDSSRRPCSLEPRTAEVTMGGTIRTRRIRGRFSFAAMVNRLRIESVGDTPRAFVYTRNERQEAFLYRQAYSVLAKGDDLIELMLGLPLTPSDLQRVPTACPRIGGSLEFNRFDDQWVKVRVTESPSDNAYDLYIRRNPDGLGWTQEVLVGQVVGRTTRWRAEFHREDSGQPSWVRLVTPSRSPLLRVLPSPETSTASGALAGSRRHSSSIPAPSEPLTTIQSRPRLPVQDKRDRRGVRTFRECIHQETLTISGDRVLLP
jgi:hypothetical protein